MLIDDIIIVEGPYAFEEVVKPRFSHGPAVVRAPDGRWEHNAQTALENNAQTFLENNAQTFLEM